MIKRQGWRGVLIGLVVGALGVAGAAYYFTSELRATQQQQDQQLLHAKVELAQVELKNQILDTQHSLDQATQEALEQGLQQKQDEIGALGEQLAFYEHLLPLSDKGTVHIRALELDAQGDDLLRYKLLLQRPAGLDTFNGHIQFTAHGQQAGSSVTMVLDTAGIESAENTAIQFDQFLRKTGLLAIPPDLKIDAVTLHIYQGKQLRATHKIDLSLK